MNVTIRDIARECGVSVATVSRAVNHTGPVSVQVQEKIFSVIRSTHWSPSSTAATLSSGRSGIIGIVLPGLTHYIYTRLLEKIRHRLQNTRYRLMISLEMTTREIDKMIAARAETVIVFSPHLLDLKEIRRMEACGIRVLGAIGHENQFPSAYSNHYEAAYAGTEILLKAGHTRIAYAGHYTSPEDRKEHPWITRTFQGFADAMSAAGLKLDEENDLIADNRQSFPNDCRENPRLKQDLLEKRHTAYLVYPWFCQLYFYILCRELGIVIPRDVSLLGIEGDILSAALNPPPAYFIHDYDAYTDIIMDFIDSDQKSESAQYSVSYKLIPGNSILNLQKAVEEMVE